MIVNSIQVYRSMVTGNVFTAPHGIWDEDLRELHIESLQMEGLPDGMTPEEFNEQNGPVKINANRSGSVAGTFQLWNATARRGQDYKWIFEGDAG